MYGDLIGNIHHQAVGRFIRGGEDYAFYQSFVNTLTFALTLPPTSAQNLTLISAATTTIIIARRDAGHS